MIMNRRSLLTGAVASIFMPAVAKAEFLMPVKAIIIEPPIIYRDIPDFFGFLYNWRKNSGQWERKLVGTLWDNPMYGIRPISSAEEVPFRQYIASAPWKKVTDWSPEDGHPITVLR